MWPPCAKARFMQITAAGLEKDMSMNVHTQRSPQLQSRMILVLDFGS
jgi:hypothetical protein